MNEEEREYLRLPRRDGNTFNATLLSFIGNERTNVKSDFNRTILRCFHGKEPKNVSECVLCLTEQLGLE